MIGPKSNLFSVLILKLIGRQKQIKETRENLKHRARVVQNIGGDEGVVENLLDHELGQFRVRIFHDQQLLHEAARHQQE